MARMIRSRATLAVLVIGLQVILSGVTPAAPPPCDIPVIDQEQPIVESLAVVGALALGDQVLAQVVTPGISGDLVAVRVAAGVHSGNLILEIQGVDPASGAPSGTVLASDSYPGSGLTYTQFMTTLALSQPVAFSAGMRFAIVVRASATGYYIQGPPGDPYEGGDGWYWSAQQGWLLLTTAVANPRYDLPFQTFVCQGGNGGDEGEGGDGDDPAPENNPPVANAGPDQTVEADDDCQASITLDGSESSDPDNDELTYTWTWGVEGVAHDSAPTIVLPLGAHAITLTVSDGNGGEDSDTVIITVADVTPPVIDGVAASPSVLWPPNHKMVPVSIVVSATDNCSEADEVTCRIISITSNEPENGLGDGNTSPDWSFDEGSLQATLRAERSGKGTGRVYTITVECADAAGNTSSEVTTVTVPHDLRKK